MVNERTSGRAVLIHAQLAEKQISKERETVSQKEFL